MVILSGKRSLLALFLSLAILMGGIVPVSAKTAPQEPVKITVIHTNDVHSRIELEPYVAAIANARKKAGENVIVLSAGDVLHGQPIATVSGGKNIVEIMNAVGYDAFTPGNHDFNYGWRRLEILSKGMNFPVLAANVQSTLTQRTRYAPYMIKEIGGVKVGVFGLATPETATKTNPKNVDMLNFQHPANVANNTIRELQREGCDAIIALSHLGMDKETLPHERSSAVAELGGVDLLIDGHSHHTLPNGELSSKGTLTVQTGSYGENIGVVELTVYPDGKVTKKASLIPVAEAGTPDPTVTNLIAKLTKELSVYTSEVVAKTSVDLQGERALARTSEVNLGNLICDAMLAETKADVALTNGGGIRASIPAGNVTKGDVLTVLPFGNYIVVKSVTGADIKAALEHGIASYPEAAGGFPQIGGMKFTFDPTRASGNRITSLTLSNGVPIDPQKTYRLATNDFMASGGDGYEMLGASGAPMSFVSLDEALIQYLATNPAIAEGPVGRIVPQPAAKAAA